MDSNQKNRIKVKTFTLTREDLERYLISKGEPEDIVVTNFAHAFNQEAWLITVQSESYIEASGLSLLPTASNNLLKEK